MKSRLPGIKKILFWLSVGILPQGFLCPQNKSVVLSPVHVDSLRLEIFDTLSLSPGIRIYWSVEENDSIEYFEPVFAFPTDSQLIITGEPRFDGNLRNGIAKLPDSTAPYHIYVGIKSLRREGTGQLIQSDSIQFMPLKIGSGPQLLKPAMYSIQDSNLVLFETIVNNDAGIHTNLEIHWLENNHWETLVDTCFMPEKCGIPLFGTQILKKQYRLPFPANGQTGETRWCITTFEGSGAIGGNPPQSMSCGAYLRKKP